MDAGRIRIQSRVAPGAGARSPGGPGIAVGFDVQGAREKRASGHPDGLHPPGRPGYTAALFKERGSPNVYLGG